MITYTIGEIKHPITIQEKVNVSAVGYEEQFEWKDLFNTKAKKYIRSANFQYNQQFGTSHLASIEFTFRDIKPEISYNSGNYRIKQGNDIYKIEDGSEREIGMIKIITTVWNESN